MPNPYDDDKNILEDLHCLPRGSDQIIFDVLGFSLDLNPESLTQKAVMLHSAPRSPLTFYLFPSSKN